MGAQSTLTSKGQTTIPKGIRESLGLKSGDKISFTMMPDGTVRMRVKNKSVVALGGALRRKGGKRLATQLLSR
jgi:antitoxin PrlF